MFVLYIILCIIFVSNVCPIDRTIVIGSGKAGSVNQVKNTRWMFQPNDSPGSFCNHCVIDHLGSVFMLLCCYFYEWSLGVGVCGI